MILRTLALISFAALAYGATTAEVKVTKFEINAAFESDGPFDSEPEIYVLVKTGTFSSDIKIQFPSVKDSGVQYTPNKKVFDIGRDGSQVVHVKEYDLSGDEDAGSVTITESELRSGTPVTKIFGSGKAQVTFQCTDCVDLERSTGACTKNSQCSEADCMGGFCCNNGFGKYDRCVACKITGGCKECDATGFLSEFEYCSAKEGYGALCGNNNDVCSIGVCSSGPTQCCASEDANCDACSSSDGGCTACKSGFELNISGICTASTYSWVTGKLGLCSETCKCGTSSRTVQCMSSVSGPVADSRCLMSASTLNKPDDSPNCNCGSCVNDTGKNFGSCSSGSECKSGSCKGGNCCDINSDTALCTSCRADNGQCDGCPAKNLKEISPVSDDSEIQYSWTYKTCRSNFSQVCGKNTDCASGYCNANKKCCKYESDSECTSCSSSDGTCLTCLAGNNPRPDDDLNCRSVDFKWEKGEWSDCSGGTKSRAVDCKQLFSSTDKFDTDENNCIGESKPDTFRVCSSDSPGGDDTDDADKGTDSSSFKEVMPDSGDETFQANIEVTQGCEGDGNTLSLKGDVSIGTIKGKFDIVITVTFKKDSQVAEVGITPTPEAESDGGKKYDGVVQLIDVKKTDFHNKHIGGGLGIPIPIHMDTYGTSVTILDVVIKDYKFEDNALSGNIATGKVEMGTTTVVAFLAIRENRFSNKIKVADLNQTCGANPYLWGAGGIVLIIIMTLLYKRQQNKRVKTGEQSKDITRSNVNP